jgi:hypothetical protein
MNPRGSNDGHDSGSKEGVFNSFLQAGFECSNHKLKTGRRLDLVQATRHDVWVSEDYDRLNLFNIRTVREGLRWPLIEKRRGEYEFASAVPMIQAAQQRNIQIIWDLFHFGWPDFLNIFSEEFPTALGDLAFAFSTVLRREGVAEPFIAPVNEMSFVAWAGGDVAYLNPFATGRGHELKRQLARAAIRASAVVRSELPDAHLVSPEPAIHIAGNPNVPGDVEDAERYRQSMFEAWDMLAGRAHADLGGREDYLEIVGLNYYDRNQWWNYGNTIRRNDAAYRPFHDILREVHERYRRPMFISETGTEDEDRPGWFRYILTEVRRAISKGIPVEGICLYPILNHPGWDDDRHCSNGLWDYAGADGSREVFEPLANEIRMTKKQQMEAKA